jgi:hypothetical protein
MDTAGRLRRLWPSSPYGCPPHRRALRAPPVRTQRTRERTDTRRSHRTLDAGHPDAGHPDTRTPGRSDADTGHWTPVAWTSHAWTLDAGRWPRTGQVRKAWPASGHPGPPCRAAARWDDEPCSCGLSTAPTVLGNHDGSTVRHLPPRETTTPLPGSCSVTPPAANRRLGTLLSSYDFRSRVERKSGRHPL